MFFGEDLLTRDQEFLQSKQHEGYSLLALDSGAIEACERAGIPYRLGEDWIGSRRFSNALISAFETSRNWYEPERDAFTTHGICWPELDQTRMLHFWQNIVLSLELTTEFERQGVRELTVFRNKKLSPGNIHHRSDAWNILMDNVFSGVTKVINSDYETVGNASEALQLMVKPFRSLKQRVADTATRILNKGHPTRVDVHIDVNSLPRSDIIIVCLTGELHRVRGLIGEASKSFSENTLVVAIQSGLHPREEYVTREGSSFDLCRLQPNPREDLSRQFLEAYRRLRHCSSEAQCGHALHHLGFHFEYYCTNRWPLLHAKLEQWITFLRGVRPRLLLTSALDLGEILVAGEAARRCGIPTVSFPHGAVQTGLKGIGKYEFSLYDSNLQRAFYESLGFRQESLLACRNLLAPDEWPTEREDPSWKQDMCNVLVLLNPTGFDASLTKSILLRNQMEGLQALAHPPHDISDRLDIHLKVHPWIPDKGIIVASSTALKEKILHPNTDLQDVLNRTDLVVGLNYSGSALVYAVRNHKPVILFLTENSLTFERHLYDFDMFRNAVEVARTGQELWSLVRRFMSDPQFVDALKAKSQSFADRYLQDRTYPTLADTLERIASC